MSFVALSMNFPVIGLPHPLPRIRDLKRMILVRGSSPRLCRHDFSNFFGQSIAGEGFLHKVLNHISREYTGGIAGHEQDGHVRMVLAHE